MPPYTPLLCGAINAIEPGQLNSEHFPVEKQNRAQCLIVGRRRHFAVCGEMRQKRLYFTGAHVARVPHGTAVARPADEEANPIDVHLLGAEAIVHVPNALAQLVQNSGGLQRKGAGFHRAFITVHSYSVLSAKLSCKPLCGGRHDQLMEQRPTYRAGFALYITLNLMSGALYVRLAPDADMPDVGLSAARVVVIAESTVSPFWQARVSTWLARSGCMYMMAWGENCSSWDDSVDMANLKEFDFGEIPHERFIMTTWHTEEPLSEVFWFSKHNATHPTVEIDRTVLLHISVQDKEREFLELYAEA